MFGERKVLSAKTVHESNNNTFFSMDVLAVVVVFYITIVKHEDLRSLQFCKEEMGERMFGAFKKKHSSLAGRFNDIERTIYCNAQRRS